MQAGSTGPIVREGDADAPSFDLESAHGALSHVDLAACRSAGLAPGYVHVSVAFAPDGTVWGVSLAVPEASTPGARTCVDAAVRDLRLAPFSGAALGTARRTIFVS
jgi:hypothetical protein